MGQLVCHKMLVEFSCRRPRRKWTSHHFHLLCQKRVYILFTVNICIFFKIKLIWSCFWQKDLGGFILLGLQVFYTEEWLQSVRLHSSSSSSPWGVSAPLLWNLGRSSMAFLRRRVWLWPFFSRGRWSLLMVAEFQRFRSWRHGKEWWNLRRRWVMERGRKWRQKEEKCGWKGYTVVLWSPKVSPVAARGEKLGCALPLYPLTQWDSVWRTWGMLNDDRGGEWSHTGLLVGRGRERR